METTVFFSNRSQAVRLPKAVALPENVKRVEVIAVGRTRIITPAGETWDEWFDGHNVSADFMDNREQPGMQERESIRMLKFMLDTNICIFTIKNKPASVRERFNLNQGRMCISSVTLMELIYGAEKSQMPERNLAVIEGFVSRIDVLDYDAAAATHSDQIRAEPARQGRPVGPFDQMIAGHARSRGLIIVTNNTREFERVDGLRISDWS